MSAALPTRAAPLRRAALLPRAVRVRAVRPDTAEASTLYLERDGAEPGAPGQFNMLAPFGVGEAAISLSGTPDGAVAHTVRAVGPVSEALRRLQPGAEVGVRGPFGVGWPVAAARGHDLVLAAGGIGLAPLRPAVEAVLADRGAFGRVLLLYGARSPADRLYVADLEAWREQGGIEVAVTVDYAEPGWTGRVGFVTALLSNIRVDPERTVAFTCGPEVMMRAVANLLAARGVPADAIYLSLERNMKCGLATCGHCQLGPYLVCRDGPVFAFDRIARFLAIREL